MKRGTRSTLALALATTFVGCTNTTITSGGEQYVTALPQIASETSAVWVPPGNLPAAWLVQYNEFTGPSTNGYAFSTDGTHWTRCNADAFGDICGGVLRGPDMASPPTRIWAGDPGLAVSPDGSVVAMTNLVQSKGLTTPARPDTVAIAFSAGRSIRRRATSSGSPTEASRSA